VLSERDIGTRVRLAKDTEQRGYRNQGSVDKGKDIEVRVM